MNALLTSTRLIFFLHLPKCGGTSVDNAIRHSLKIAGEGRINPVAARKAANNHLKPKSNQEFFREYPYLQKYLLKYAVECEQPYISGHLPLDSDTIDFMKSRYRLITLMREPLERWKSHYLYNKMTMNDPMVPPLVSSNDEPLSELQTIAESWRGWQLGSLCTTFLSGSLVTPENWQELVHVAVDNLKEFTIVGSLDDMQSFESALSSDLESNIRVNIDNSTLSFVGDLDYYRRLQSCFSGSILDTIRNQSIADLALWDLARKESLFCESTELPK